MGDYWNQGKADYSDDHALGVRYVLINAGQTNRVYALSAHSYFCLNTAQYIHVVECSMCFITDARLCWRSL